MTAGFHHWNYLKRILDDIKHGECSLRGANDPLGKIAETIIDVCIQIKNSKVLLYLNII